TCIGAFCEPDESVVITRDSDLICFDRVSMVAMPMGQKREFMLFHKRELLEHLELPSAHHLLLAAVVTSNDYGKGLYRCGIKTNINHVRHLDLDLGSGELLQCIKTGVQEYIDSINRQSGTAFHADFSSAIEAF
ncbi:hypothetical protein BGZ65_006168, partial [Modicella reniformis]